MDIIVFFRQDGKKIILTSFENGHLVYAIRSMRELQLYCEQKLEIEILPTN